MIEARVNSYLTVAFDGRVIEMFFKPPRANEGRRILASYVAEVLVVPASKRAPASLEIRLHDGKQYSFGAIDPDCQPAVEQFAAKVSEALR